MAKAAPWTDAQVRRGASRIKNALVVHAVMMSIWGCGRTVASGANALNRPPAGTAQG